jgi:hypoxanthine phosphoribosyltransferase
VSGDKFDCEIMSWERFHDLSEKTSRRIIESGFRPDFMVGLARGGWVLSRVLCDFLGVKDLISLKVEHWGITATPDGEAKIKYPFHVDLTGRRVLVVDDIADTGKSLIVATNYVRTLKPLEVRTATLILLKDSKFKPDFYSEEQTWRWVVFPWNYVEDMCNLVAKASGGGADLDTVKARLKANFRIDVDVDEVAKIQAEIRRRSG